MKKIVIVLAAALLALSSFKVSAQSGWEVDAGISPSLMDFMSTEASVGKKNPSFVLPYLSLRGGYSFPGSFVGVYMDLGFSYASTTYTGGPSVLKEREPVFHLTPQVRLYYMNKDKWRLYAFVGAGVRVYHYAETFEGDTITRTEWKPSWAFSPFACSFGSNWNVSLELGIGRGWAPMRLCAGYRF